MPADLLQPQTEVDQPSRESAGSADQENIADSRHQKSHGIPRKTIWRKIFEGHEEFLGLTPD